MKLIAKILGVLVICMSFSESVKGQVSRYQGSYYLYAGYTSHKFSAYPVKATFGLGTATLRSNGTASYTCSFPFDGWAWINSQRVSLDPFTGSGTGVVNSTGVFSFRNNVVGQCQLWGTLRNGVLAIKSAGLGTFTDGYGSGIFGIVKYR